MAGLRHWIPSKGDRIVEQRAGRAGTVWYADHLQMLVKWDDGGSSSVRIGEVGFDLLNRRCDEGVAEDPPR